MFTETVVGYAVGKTFDFILRSYYKTTEKRRIKHAAISAFKNAAQEFHEKFPALNITKDDKLFIERLVGAVTFKLIEPGEEADLEGIANAYHAMNPSVTIKHASDAFNWFFNEVRKEFEKEPKLAHLMHLRRAASTFQNSEDILHLAKMLPSIVEDLKMLITSATPDTEPHNYAELFRRKSGDLLEWPQTLTTGEWFERPELGQLQTLLTDGTTRLILLLGSAGCGKSALLSRLTGTLQSQGTTCLALKADCLPKGIGTMHELQAHLELPEALPICMNRMADNGPVVLLIDQLDALCDLMVMEHTERLSVLLSIISEVYALKHQNIKVVVSTRSFEAKHDSRLRSLVERSRLGGPQETVACLEMENVPWDMVDSVLEGQGVSTSSWTDDFRKMLRTPQHLDVFLRFLKDTQNMHSFTAFPQMLEEVWQRNIVDVKDSSERIELMTRLAEDLAETEELWAPEHLYSKGFSGPLRELKSVGILRSGEGRAVVGFMHQTFFDFTRSKAFLAREDSLSDYVLARQTSLFVRPILWSALGHLRALDFTRYSHEFQKLWDGVTRRHLHYLLIDFLGSQLSPKTQEITWLLPCLEEHELQANALKSMFGSKGWFEVLESEKLPQLMAMGAASHLPIRQFLISAIPFAQDSVVKLLRRFWIDNPEMDSESLWVLREAQSWDDGVMDLLLVIIRRTQIAVWLIVDIVQKITEQNPERAARVLDASLNYAFSMMAVRDDAEFTQLLKIQEGHGLAKTVQRAPAEFCRTLFPWFISVIEHAESYQLKGNRYLSVDFIADREDDDSRVNHYPIYSAVLASIKGYAQTNPEGFFDDVAVWKSSQHMIVHSLICQALNIVAQSYPQAVLSYLKEDSRRLAIGNMRNLYGFSQTVIRSVATALNKAECLELERLIHDWDPYPFQSNEDVSTDKDLHEWNEISRYRLYTAIPISCRSDELQQHIDNIENKHRPAEVDSTSYGFIKIESAMSTEEMLTKTNDEIVDFFNIVQDDQEHHPYDFMKGGSIEASREFSKFAESNSDRVISIVRQFNPGKQENPAAYALEGMHKGGVHNEKILSLCIELHRKGFSSETFRVHAGMVLEKIAVSDKGLPDEITEILLNWLMNYEESSDFEPINESERGILWDSMRMHALSTNSILLAALNAGYICRDTQDYRPWVQAMQTVLDGPTNARSWARALSSLSHLGRADHAQASAFVSSLIMRFPEILNSFEGVHLFAYAQHWGDEATVSSWFSLFLDMDTEFAHQAFGELVTLRNAVYPQDSWCSDHVDRILDTTAPCPSYLAQQRLGCAFTLSNLWEYFEYRPQITDAFERLAPKADIATAKAILDVFRVTKILTLDNYTQRILTMIVDNQQFLEYCIDYFLVNALMDCVERYPNLVLDICKHIVNIVGEQMNDHRTSWPHDSEKVVDIALTLHRMPGFQEEGLSLYEDMLMLEAYGAKKALHDIDRRIPM